jgi:arylsulfatase A-like enzyme
VPVRFYDQYGDPLKHPIAKVQRWPITAPSISWHPWFNQMYIDDIDTSQYTRRVAYYAAISYFDEHLGQVLDTLEACGKTDTTAILMAGDHGN